MDGIKMPALQYRWRVVMNSPAHLAVLTNDATEIIKSATKVSVNYKSKTIKLDLIQSVDGYLNLIMFLLCKERTFPLRIDVLTGAEPGDIHHATEFIGANIVDHNITYDYSKSDTVKHSLEIKFDGLILLEQVKDEVVRDEPTKD